MSAMVPTGANRFKAARPGYKGQAGASGHNSYGQPAPSSSSVTSAAPAGINVDNYNKMTELEIQVNNSFKLVQNINPKSV